MDTHETQNTQYVNVLFTAVSNKLVEVRTKEFWICRKSPGRTAINRSISADPNMNDPEIQAKIGNRMTKTVEKSIGT